MPDAPKPLTDARERAIAKLQAKVKRTHPSWRTPDYVVLLKLRFDELEALIGDGA